MASDEHDRILEIIGEKDRAPLALPVAATALLVIDMQHCFVRRGANFTELLERLAPGVSTGYFERVFSRVVPNVARLLTEFRRAGLPVFFTGTGTEDGTGSDLAPWLRGFDDLGRTVLGASIWPRVDTSAWRIDVSVEPQPGEPVLCKTTADPFLSTGLDRLLADRGVTTLVVAGLTTDVCVSAAARAAADRGYTVIVAADGCTTLSEAMHRGALEAIALAFGRTKTTDQLVQLLRDRPDVPAEPPGPIVAA